MGCDIHAHIEYKAPSDTSCEYEWLGSVNPGGAYALFALLAGVRAGWVERHYGIDIEALFAPRGLPDQLSYMTEGDGLFYVSKSTGTRELEMENHSHSWLSTAELQLVLEAYIQLFSDSLEEYKAQNGTELGIELKAIIRAMETLPNARLVFWFDN